MEKGWALCWSSLCNCKHPAPGIALNQHLLPCKTRKTACPETSSLASRGTAVCTHPAPMPRWTHSRTPEAIAPAYPKDSITHAFSASPRAWPCTFLIPTCWLNFPAWPQTFLGIVDLAGNFWAVADPGCCYQTFSALAGVLWDHSTCQQGHSLCLPCCHPWLSAHGPLLLPDNMNLQFCLQWATPVLERNTSSQTSK